MAKLIVKVWDNFSNDFANDFVIVIIFPYFVNMHIYLNFMLVESTG